MDSTCAPSGWLGQRFLFVIRPSALGKPLASGDLYRRVAGRPLPVPQANFDRLSSRLSECVRLRESGRVAQVVEQCPFKAWVAGSNPAALTKLEGSGPETWVTECTGMLRI
jgi:hypothetical protein